MSDRELFLIHVIIHQGWASSSLMRARQLDRWTHCWDFETQHQHHDLVPTEGLCATAVKDNGDDHPLTRASRLVFFPRRLFC